ncbi:MAG TPA: hypothetical protein VM889_02335 [Candidatus Thermoplasmatota archaeon]|nr:hypothetical protein [Candidatus Thermoplasmatota archaeon]
MRGEVVFLYVYDVGAEVDLDRVGSVLDEHPAFEPVEIRKTAPKYVALARPLTLRFPGIERETSVGRLRFDLTARIFEIGAVSLQVRASFEVETLGDLHAWGNLRVYGGADLVSPRHLAQTYLKEMVAGLGEALVKRYADVSEPETYTAYAITDLGKLDIPTLLKNERRALAGLIASESDPGRLSMDEVEDNLYHMYRYYDDDLVVADWDVAVVVEPSGRYEDVLYVMELANLQLLELRTYDQYLDGVLDKAYDDLSRFFETGARSLFLSARDVVEDLADARIDLIRVTDEINNIGKIFGDWYLAKLHRGLAERFHLAEWETIVKEKMETLNALYGLATHEVEHRRGIVLEGAIVLLFIVDLVLVFLTLR